MEKERIGLLYTISLFLCLFLLHHLSSLTIMTMVELMKEKGLFVLYVVVMIGFFCLFPYHRPPPSSPSRSFMVM